MPLEEERQEEEDEGPLSKLSFVGDAELRVPVPARLLLWFMEMLMPLVVSVTLADRGRVLFGAMVSLVATSDIDNRARKLC